MADEPTKQNILGVSSLLSAQDGTAQSYYVQPQPGLFSSPMHPQGGTGQSYILQPQSDAQASIVTHENVHVSGLPDATVRVWYGLSTSETLQISRLSAEELQRYAIEQEQLGKSLEGCSITINSSDTIDNQNQYYDTKHENFTETVKNLRESALNLRTNLENKSQNIIFVIKSKNIVENTRSNRDNNAAMDKKIKTITKNPVNSETIISEYTDKLITIVQNNPKILPDLLKYAAKLTTRLDSSELVLELIEDSSIASSATHSVPQEGRGRGRPRSGVADAVEAELLQRPAKIIDDPQARARALNTLAQRRRRERKASNG